MCVRMCVCFVFEGETGEEAAGSDAVWTQMMQMPWREREIERERDKQREIRRESTERSATSCGENTMKMCVWGGDFPPPSSLRSRAFWGIQYVHVSSAPYDVAFSFLLQQFVIYI